MGATRHLTDAQPFEADVGHTLESGVDECSPQVPVMVRTSLALRGCPPRGSVPGRFHGVSRSDTSRKVAHLGALRAPTLIDVARKALSPPGYSFLHTT